MSLLRLRLSLQRFGSSFTRLIQSAWQIRYQNLEFYIQIHSCHAMSIPHLISSQSVAPRHLGGSPGSKERTGKQTKRVELDKQGKISVREALVHTGALAVCFDPHTHQITTVNKIHQPTKSCLRRLDRRRRAAARGPRPHSAELDPVEYVVGDPGQHEVPHEPQAVPLVRPHHVARLGARARQGV